MAAKEIYSQESQAGAGHVNTAIKSNIACLGMVQLSDHSILPTSARLQAVRIRLRGQVGHARCMS